ncbi:MAG: hypothetical protein RR394_04360 [Oscillospiraceae bacterium]
MFENTEVQRLVLVEQACEINAEGIEKLEARQNNLDKLVSTVATMANEQEHIKADVTVIKADVKALAIKPAQRWDGFVDKLIWAICGGVLTFLLSTILARGV